MASELRQRETTKVEIDSNATVVIQGLNAPELRTSSTIKPSHAAAKGEEIQSLAMIALVVVLICGTCSFGILYWSGALEKSGDGTGLFDGLAEELINKY